MYFFSWNLYLNTCKQNIYCTIFVICFLKSSYLPTVHIQNFSIKLSVFSQFFSLIRWLKLPRKKNTYSSYSGMLRINTDHVNQVITKYNILIIWRIFFCHKSLLKLRSSISIDHKKNHNNIILQHR